MPMLNFQSSITKKINEIKTCADEFPGVVIIHNIPQNFNKIEYMSARGRNILGLTESEITEMGPEYYTRFFNEEDAKHYVPKMIEMVKRNDENTIYSFFQQVRKSDAHPWAWYHSSTRILLKDEIGQPLLSITFAVPIDPEHHLTNKVSKLLDENNYLRLNSKEYSKLTSREKEITQKLAKGLSSSEISEALFISAETVKTHRKNIYQKLKINSAHELFEFARAFDLI